MDEKTGELITMIGVFGLPALIIGFVVVLLLRRLIGHRSFRRVLFALCLIAAAIGCATSYAFITQPSMATALLPITLGAAGAGLGGLFATFRR